MSRKHAKSPNQWLINIKHTDKQRKAAGRSQVQKLRERFAMPKPPKNDNSSGDCV